MALKDFDVLYQEADARRQPIPIAVAGGADQTVLEALRSACDRGWICPLVVGSEADIRHIAGTCGIRLEGFTLIDADQPAAAAVALVRNGQVRLLMKGQIATPALLHAVLDRALGLRSNQVICQVVLMEIPACARRFLLADTGICINPTLAEKCAILRSTAAVARTLGVGRPNVAVLAATETIVPAMPETVAARELERLGSEGAFGNCTVRGPLSFDLAYAPEAGAKKQISGAGVGSADIMLFPNLLSANLTVKAIMYTAACRFGGVLCGAACPVVFMSRADTTGTRLNSLALALQLVNP
jgi:phosphate butyryltransferase